MLTVGPVMPEARILMAIRRHQDELIGAIQKYLQRCIDSRFDVDNGFDGDNAVCGLWTARQLIEEANPAAIFYASAGEDVDVQFTGPECLAMNAFYKARACAQTGLDTIVCVEYPEQWLAVQGPYFPWAGAIIRGIGRHEFVLSTSGFTQIQDHGVSEYGWGRTTDFAKREIDEDLRRADLDSDNPEFVKYPVGWTPQPITASRIVSVPTPQGLVTYATEQPGTEGMAAKTAAPLKSSGLGEVVHKMLND